jgi:Uma2 family endonuclease
VRAQSSFAASGGSEPGPEVAECGVPEYWVVNVRDGLVEVFTDIVSGAYTRVVPYRRDDVVTPRSFSDVAIADVL